jgi:hypothetical protein
MYAQLDQMQAGSLRHPDNPTVIEMRMFRRKLHYI